MTKTRNKLQRGFAVIELAIFVVVITAVSGIGYWAVSKSKAVTSPVTITITAPVDTTSSYQQGGSVPVRFSTNQIIRTGEFGVWSRSSNGTYYSYKSVSPNISTTSYAVEFPLTKDPVGSGYQIIMAYRPQSGTGTWNNWATSSGSFKVTSSSAPTLTPTPIPNAVTITITAPVDTTSSYQQGGSVPVRFSTNQIIRTGEFGVWSRSSNGTYYSYKSVSPNISTTSYAVEFPLTKDPVGSGYQIIMAYRPQSGTGTWNNWATSSGSFKVNPSSTPISGPTSTPIPTPTSGLKSIDSSSSSSSSSSTAQTQGTDQTSSTASTTTPAPKKSLLCTITFSLLGCKKESATVLKTTPAPKKSLLCKITFSLLGCKTQNTSSDKSKAAIIPPKSKPVIAPRSPAMTSGSKVSADATTTSTTTPIVTSFYTTGSYQQGTAINLQWTIDQPVASGEWFVGLYSYESSNPAYYDYVVLGIGDNNNSTQFSYNLTISTAPEGSGYRAVVAYSSTPGSNNWVSEKASAEPFTITSSSSPTDPKGVSPSPSNRWADCTMTNANVTKGITNNNPVAMAYTGSAVTGMGINWGDGTQQYKSNPGNTPIFRESEYKYSVVKEKVTRKITLKAHCDKVDRKVNYVKQTIEWVQKPGL
ncbi:MAG: hypothetical protein WCK26_03845 [Candidatus Saccharibacteria bacterium]